MEQLAGRSGLRVHGQLQTMMLCLKHRPGVSIIVPFAGSREDAKRTLACLSRVELKSQDEAIVVDNTAEGNFAAVCAIDSVSVLVANAKRSPYHARNAGALQASAEWLLFLDADCVPMQHLLDAYFDPALDPSCGVVAGGLHALPDDATLVARWAGSRDVMNEEFLVRHPFRPAGAGGNLLFRAKAWREAGGFHEVRSGGDIELCWRLQDLGWSFDHRPAARVEHAHNRTFGDLGRQARRHGGGRAWLCRRYPDSMPRQRLVRPLTRCALGLVVGTLTLQFERAALKAVDAFQIINQATGWLRANRAPNRVQDSQRGPRVAVFCDNFPALPETFINSEVRVLRDLGWSVRVESFARPTRPDVALAQETGVWQVEDDGNGRKLLALGQLVARHPIGCFRDFFGRLRWRQQEEVWPLRALALPARRIARGEEHHIHAHFAAAAGLNAMRLASILKKTFSVTAHAYDIYQRPANLREKLQSAAFATSGCEYTVQDLRQMLGQAGASSVHKIVMGVDGEQFRRRARVPAAHELVAVGRLVEKKGFTDLIAAVSLLRERFPRVRLRLAGDGPLRGELQQQITALHVDANVELLGWRSPEAIRELLEGADLLVMPCVVAADGDRDSMPLVVKEALAMEIPVVGTEEVGLPEIVHPGWGRLVPPHDPGALAAATAELLRFNLEEREAMGKEGRKYVLEHANVVKETGRLAELMTEAMGASLPAFPPADPQPGTPAPEPSPAVRE